jgi:hypothetical protein
MSKRLRVISVNFPFQNQDVVQEPALATDKAFFDFDVVVIRPERFDFPGGQFATYKAIELTMNRKRAELVRLFTQGGVLVVLLDIPNIYTIQSSGYTAHSFESTTNYAFIDQNFWKCLASGSGRQIHYSDPTEPFVRVLKKSTVAWTAYVAKTPDYPFNTFRFFASVGAGTSVAGVMPYRAGHLILLPNLEQLDETQFLDACAEYRFKRQAAVPHDWVKHVYLPGLMSIESDIANVDKQISELQTTKNQKQELFDNRAAYRKLLYEKGKAQLEPIVLRALNDLAFKTKPSEVIAGTNFEIDGRTTVGSLRGIIEIKGSKNPIVLDEFSPFVVKILADHQANNASSKGILVGNGLCETIPEKRVGDSIFSPHVIDAAQTHSVVLINTVELYWLCCTLLDGAKLDLGAIRELILGCNGYADLKPFCGKSPWQEVK